MVPFPGFRVDRLAHCAQHLEGGGVAARHMIIAFSHQRSDERWRCVELLHLHR